MSVCVPPSLTSDSFLAGGGGVDCLPNQQVGKKLNMRGNTDEATVSAAFGRLTKRQSSVLALMLEGLTNKDIAQRLGLSEESVKGHVSAISNALG